MRIEKGCMAIIVDGLCQSNIGKVVTVVNYLGDVPYLRTNGYWEVDQLMEFTDGVYRYINRESCMKRIDDQDLSIKTKETNECEA